MTAARIWSAEDWRAAASGRWLRAPGDAQPIRGVAIDSREIAAGAAFVALPGERTDGHRFVAQAAEAGAALVVITDAAAIDVDSVPDSCSVLVVDDAARALADAANAYRHKVLADADVIGVTGSNGKTTAVRMLSAALRGAGLRVAASRKSFNNHLGVPITLINADPASNAVVCEMGMNSPGEIGHVVQIAEPTAAMVVSIGRAHLEQLGSVEAIAREKASIFSGLVATRHRSRPIA
ncbi:MAG: Mur ligase family protein, partial [Planctomycetota bacterium]